ncbi:MAG: DsbA family protein [Thiothrix sp.]|uniref:DsbA family protein n=1 Tax=Thiothrix sp. TaxID=1032 RepID=UPI00262652C3|nr:DsbA family protein [Thiothrix sp.]MDD5395009.1 DsbA family protein [Thiothrix sp.]
MLSRRAFLLGTTGSFLANLPLVGVANGAGTGGRSFMGVFSFACPYCYKLSLQLGIWLPLNPQVKHYPVHIVSSPDDLKLAAAGYSAAVLGKGDAFRAAFFKAIYEGNQKPDERTMVAVAESVGLEAAGFVAAIKGADVAELLARSEDITQQFQITATPAFIIDMQRLRLPDKDPLEILQEEFGKA